MWQQRCICLSAKSATADDVAWADIASCTNSLGLQYRQALHHTCHSTSLPVLVQATGSKVERVVITRLENHTYYSRIVLSLPDGVQRSVDSRPSDSLALALQCEAPLFVARQLAQ